MTMTRVIAQVHVQGSVQRTEIGGFGASWPNDQLTGDHNLACVMATVVRRLREAQT